MKNSFAARLEAKGEGYTYFPVSAVSGYEKLPFALTVLLENVLRNAESPEVARSLADRIVSAGLAGETGEEVEFSPARVLFHGRSRFRRFRGDARGVRLLGRGSEKDKPSNPVRFGYRPFRYRRRRGLRGLP